ncbi:DUF2330 domain-containing protein [Ktedonospora formicarum]|uniref:DUF2330 domain-containing protein n=1 Tax=Ktedonospora formicarum TaxID=2778364 RepID=A0A8J3I990_9CHLR|nr:DUF2330 domain-containing protein [Ktedonospora formicarum]GHO49553.1 hypothetical protein KSX_77160 [Ktedonospora formicarum]
MLQHVLSLRRLLAGSMLALALILFSPLSALACGGLFVGANQAKVSQDTERLLITIGKQTTTLVEEIHYTGKASDFAWVLPVPVAPKVDVLENKNLFEQLENTTAPRFIVPEAPNCDYADITLLNRGDYAGAPNTVNRVNTYSGGTAGPFEYQVIGSSDAEALAKWLQSHHYTVPSNTQNLIQPYIQKKMLFLAMRLRPGQDASNIQPVKVTFPMVMTSVMVPIQLAATDIQTRMNMQVSIVANERFAPQNYRDVSIDSARLSMSPTPGANYYELVNEAIASVGGYGIVTQYAGPAPYFLNDRALGAPTGTVPEQATLTRFYTSYTPEHMTLDPIFAPNANAHAINSYIELKDTTTPPNCTLTYLKSAAILFAFPIAPVAILVSAAIIWYRRRHRHA